MDPEDGSMQNMLQMITSQLRDQSLQHGRMGSYGGEDELEAFVKKTKILMNAGPPPIYAALLRPPWRQRQEFMAGYKYFKSQATADSPRTVTIRHTMVPSIEHGEAPAIDGLTRTSIRDVAGMVNHIHTDKIIFVKIIHAPYTVVGRSMLVEDDDGDCVTLSLYNCKHDLSVNTCLALLAPYMKNSQDNREAPLMLRCDNPQCVIAFDTPTEWRAMRDGKQPPSERLDALKLKELGNRAFGQERYTAAQSLYSRALRVKTIDNESHIACLSNRAEAALREERWEDAEYDATQVLAMDKDHVKGKYRLAKASIRLGKPGKALEMTKVLLATSPKDKIFLKIAADAELALQEQNGIFDVSSMRKEASSSSSKTSFHADYVSPAIEIGADIALLSGKTYRGCRALRDIPANALLTASKAFANAQDPTSGPAIQLDVQSKHINNGSQIQLASDIVAKLYKRPMLGKFLYKLSSGVDFDSREMGDSGKIDISRIRRLLSSNSFRSHDESDDAQRDWTDMFNAPDLTTKTGSNPNNGATGLWLTESMFNHSCAPNCTWSQIDDHMFIRSVRPIRKGEELCISYSGHEDCYQVRKDRFARWIAAGVGFECQCTVCAALRTDGKLREMESNVHAAFEGSAKLLSTTQTTMALAAEKMMSFVERQRLLSDLQYYPLHLQHNTGANLHIMHGVCLNEKGETQAALEHFQKAANIGYAVRGGRHMSWAKDTWRVVGSSLRCEKTNRAKELLHEIWKSSVFGGFSSSSEAQDAFVDLTLKHALPWWVDDLDRARVRILRTMATDVASTTRKANSKPRRGKKKVLNSLQS